MYTGPLAPTSNRADWRFNIELLTPTNDFVDFTGATIIIAITPDEQINPLITGSNIDGHVTVTGPGAAAVAFARSEMTTLLPASYKVGITVKLADGVTHQIFAGTLPVVDGVVAA